MGREELKERAREQIKGRIGVLFLMYLVIIGITSVTSWIPGAGAFANFFVIAPAFEIGMLMVYTSIYNGAEIKAGDVLDGFYHFWGAFKITFFASLFSVLWSFLLFFPGIIKAYSYSMALYIWNENKELGALEAIQKSKEMMDGHKMDLFVLGLSFIGWFFLGMVTFGIAFIYAVPYMEMTMLNFYHSIKPQDYAGGYTYTAMLEE